jgi:hypothetical protein
MLCEAAFSFIIPALTKRKIISLTEYSGFLDNCDTMICFKLMTVQQIGTLRVLNTIKKTTNQIHIVSMMRILEKRKPSEQEWCAINFSLILLVIWMRFSDYSREFMDLTSIYKMKSFSLWFTWMKSWFCN